MWKEALMARLTFGPIAPLPLTLVALLLLALLPTRVTSWLGALRQPANFVVLPIAHPLLLLTRSMQENVMDDDPDPRIEAIRIERDDLAARLAQARTRIDELERLVQDLQGGLAVAPEESIRAFEAPIVGVSPNPDGGLLRVGAGAREGVVAGESVAVARGVHLIGRVQGVESRTCFVTTLSNQDLGWIFASVMVEDPDRGWRCQLRPIGQGRLQGEVVSDATGIAVGQTVRLQDNAWPASAQMLVLGRVSEVEQRQNGRIVITVQTEVDPSRLTEVVLRAPAPADATSDP
jgi:cell shape-determining protein MreC